MADRIKETAKIYAHNWRKEHPDYENSVVKEIEEAFIRGGQCAETMFTMWMPIIGGGLGIKAVESQLPVLIRRVEHNGHYYLVDDLSWEFAWKHILEENPEQYWFRKIVDNW